MAFAIAHIRGGDDLGQQWYLDGKLDKRENTFNDFVDVLNTMLDESLPLTPGEWPEWGNPVEDPKAFELIRSYSPYDNVKPQVYPPMFISGGLNDPRVTYWEPAKWAAKLRATKTDDNVLVLKTNMGAGHGGKSGRWESLKEAADEMAFVLWQLGVEE